MRKQTRTHIVSATPRIYRNSTLVSSFKCLPNPSRVSRRVKITQRCAVRSSTTKSVCLVTMWYHSLLICSFFFNLFAPKIKGNLLLLFSNAPLHGWPLAPGFRASQSQSRFTSFYEKFVERSFNWSLVSPISRKACAQLPQVQRSIRSPSLPIKLRSLHVPISSVSTPPFHPFLSLAPRVRSRQSGRISRP
jgi:hypothetical protein